MHGLGNNICKSFRIYCNIILQEKEVLQLKNNVVAVYLRVSTDSQTEYSPDAQLKAIKDYAKKHDLQIDSKYIFRDEGISGRKAEKRPEFMRMIATAKMKPHSPFSKILVHKFDRFARNREDSVVYKSLLKKECNVDVVSITEDFGEDKFSVILEAMLEAMAEYYSLNLSDEVMKGMVEKANRGEYQTKAPFGYKMVDKKLIVEETQSKLVKMIYYDYLNGLGFQKIAKKLNDMKIKTNRGNNFEVRTIEYILRNPIYAGTVSWCPGSKNSWDFNYRNNNAIKKDGLYPSIISKEDFQKVQDKITANKEKFKYVKNDEKQHWLRKLVKCSNCGSTLTTTQNSLQCIGYAHGSCNESHHICINKITNAILEQLKNDFNYPINLRIKHITKNNNYNEIEILENLIKQEQEKLIRCKNLYIEGIDTLEEYKENKINITNKLKEYEAKLNSIQPTTEKSENNDFSINVKNLYEMLVDNSMDMDVKYTAVHEIIDKIVYNKKEETLEIIYKN